MTLVDMEVGLMIITAITMSASVYLNLVLHQKKYAQHVVFDQPTKSQKRVLEHPFIYFLGILLLVIFYSWFLAYYVKGDLQQFLFGFFISLFSIVLGQSIGGILIFLYTIKKPEKISGEVFFKDKKFLALHILAVFMPCATLLVSLAIIYPYMPFIWGSLVAITILLLSPLIQLLKR